MKQLRFSFIKGPSSITIMSSKAMLDLGLWHGPHEVDKTMNQDVTSQFKDQKVDFSSINCCDASEYLHIGMLDMLYWVMERNCISDFVESDEIEFVQAVLAEGFAKILLLSEKYPNADASSHPLLLGKLIGLFFSSDSKDHLRWIPLSLSIILILFISMADQSIFFHLTRLKQCLSVFFDHYPSLSANHKACVVI